MLKRLDAVLKLDILVNSVTCILTTLVLGLSRKYGDTCFWSTTSTVTWPIGRDSCEAASGQPAKVDNAEEWQMLLNDHIAYEFPYISNLTL